MTTKRYALFVLIAGIATFASLILMVAMSGGEVAKPAEYPNREGFTQAIFWLEMVRSPEEVRSVLGEPGTGVPDLEGGGLEQRLHLVASIRCLCADPCQCEITLRELRSAAVHAVEYVHHHVDGLVLTHDLLDMEVDVEDSGHGVETSAVCHGSSSYPVTDGS